MPARWNVAMTAALAERYARGGAADTVRFHRYRACVLLGSGQSLEGAADIGYCRREGIEIARRVTGGGAVYMSPGMLAWDVLVARASLRGDLSATMERVCSGVAAGLARLGVPARFRAPNDIEIGGRKVSGSSGYAAGRVVVVQGTVLVDDDVPPMALALRLSEADLRKRVTSLAGEVGAAPAPAAIIDCIAVGLAEALDREPARAWARDDEVALCSDLLRGEIGTEAYVAGHTAAPI
jgi:lipoate-protein ligase A